VEKQWNAAESCTFSVCSLCFVNTSSGWTENKVYAGDITAWRSFMEVLDDVPTRLSRHSQWRHQFLTVH